MITSPVVKTNSNAYCTSNVLDTNLAYLTHNVISVRTNDSIQVLLLIMIINSLSQITLT